MGGSLNTVAACAYTYLEITEPDLVVEDGEGEDVVDERLRFPRLWWYAEYLGTRRLAQLDGDTGSRSGDSHV